MAFFWQVYKDVGANDQHNAYDADVANSFYNLATEFYEYGWGDSFHFGFRRHDEPHSKAIANSQNFVAAKLQVCAVERIMNQKEAWTWERRQLERELYVLLLCDHHYHHS